MIPPDIAGSALQAGFTSSEASRIRDADRAGQQRIAARQSQVNSDAIDSVGTGDGDTAVFSDAEGTGGQGRSFSETASEEADGMELNLDESATAESATANGDTSQVIPHLDIQA